MTVAVKICGITNLEDAFVAIDAGADLLGFILYPKSSRYVKPELVAEIVSEIKDRRSKVAESASNPDLRSSIFAPACFVGVFVNEPLEGVRQIMAVAGLDYAQLHGDEEPEMVAALAGRAFKALRPANAKQALADAKRFAISDRCQGPQLLVDAYDPREYGGTGKKADWHVAAEISQQHSGLLLAGGLTPDNVADAIASVNPWGVDVSSGVEASPGRKDHDKVRRFIAQARSVG